MRLQILDYLTGGALRSGARGRSGAAGFGYTPAWLVLQRKNRDVKELLAQLRLRYRYPGIVLRAMVATDFKVRYQASLLGYLWTLLKPLAMFSILYLVFVRLLKIGASIPHYAIYLLFGIVIWSFFVDATMQGLASLVQRAELLRKISFPRYVVVVSVGVSAMINFALNMVVIVLFLALARVPLRADVLWLPLLFVELVALSVSLAFFLSALYVRFRDMTYIWEVLMQAGFYAVPIIYPLSLVPRKYARFLLLNPMAQIIQDARYCLVSDQAQTMTQVFSTPWARAIPVGITLVLVVTSVFFFRSRSPSFAEEA
jgi:ABC-2 type transport system permease protein